MIAEPPPEPADAHVRAAEKVFRDVGFTLAAMQYPRPPEALAALRRFNRAPDGWVEPVGWRYFPNEWCRDYWSTRQLDQPAPSGNIAASQ